MSSVALEQSNPDADGLVGGITEWGSNVLPSTKYRFCDGSELSRADFSLLFSRYGELHGVGDGSTTFNIPNLVDKLVRGTNGSIGVEVGTTGGTTAATMPTHSHSISPNPHSHSSVYDVNPAGATAGAAMAVPSGFMSTGTTSLTIGDAGGSGDNWPPFVRLRHIIKVL